MVKKVPVQFHPSTMPKLRKGSGRPEIPTSMFKAIVSKKLDRFTFKISLIVLEKQCSFSQRLPSP